MVARLTDYPQRVKKVHGKALKPVEAYVNAHTAIYHVCNQGHRRKMQPTSVLQGRGCLDCHYERRKQTRIEPKDMEKRLAVLAKRGIYAKTKYTKSDVKMTFACDNGHRWQATLHSITHGGNGCSQCAGNRQIITDEYAEELKTAHPNVRVIGEYVNWATPVKHKCLACENVFMRQRVKMLSGNGCLVCHPPVRKYSKVAIRWLKRVAKREAIKIRHAENGGEYTIPLAKGITLRVDGYCKQTNTVYEFYGDAIHGNPKIFSPTDKPHPWDRDVTAKELLRKTKRREKIILARGYKLITRWHNHPRYFSPSGRPSA
jgi:Zn finger protein HypA/HybF involved in hydrogenase expression